MIPWSKRSIEERTLLNPGFCANLLWHAANGYASIGNGALSFEESFLILPFVLHRKTREALPKTTRTSLAVWLNDEPLLRGRIVTHARFLVPFTKEGITFGGVRGLIRIENGRIHAVAVWKKAVNITLRNMSDEVRFCAKRAEFIGKWFAQTGSSTTVLALMGVRP